MDFLVWCPHLSSNIWLDTLEFFNLNKNTLLYLMSLSHVHSVYTLSEPHDVATNSKVRIPDYSTGKGSWQSLVVSLLGSQASAGPNYKVPFTPYIHTLQISCSAYNRDTSYIIQEYIPHNVQKDGSYLQVYIIYHKRWDISYIVHQ